MKYLIAIVATVAAMPAFADTITGAYAGCRTKDALSELITAANADDYRQMNALLGNACFNIEGREYSVVSRGFTTSKIRVYAGGSSVLLWVPSAAIK